MNTDVETIVKNYLDTFFREHKHISASNMGTSELSYRRTLGVFLDNLIHSMRQGKNCHLLDEPRNTGSGRPDFAILDSNDSSIYLYIESKGPSKDPIDATKHAEQISKYLELEVPLILTDGLEFLYFSHPSPEPEKRIVLVKDKESFIKGRGTSVSDKALKDIDETFETVLAKKKIRKTKCMKLMPSLAKRARFLKDDFNELLCSNPSSEPSLSLKKDIEKIFEIFKNHLSPDLDEESFSSMSAQLMIFSLFMIYLETLDEEMGKRVESFMGRFESLNESEIKPIAALSGLLKKIGNDLGPIAIGWKNAASLLAYTDLVDEQLPSYHELYESFYDEFDHDERLKLGAFYTPKEIAEFIAEMSASLLNDHFGTDMFHENVKMVDPGAGTATFLEVCVEKFFRSGKKAMDCGLYGIEIAAAPYVLGQIRLHNILSKCPKGKTIKRKPQLFLGNSLSDEMVESFGSSTEKPSGEKYTQLLEKEFAGAKKAAMRPILLVFGNPPSSDNSQNIGENFKAIEMELERIRPPAEERKGRSNIQKQLQNDFVKFIMWACLKLDNTGGVIAYVVPSSLLRKRTYMHMRIYLKEFFDEIYVLEFDSDLRNQTNKDDNVFEVQQGRAVIAMVRKKRKGGSLSQQSVPAELFYTSIKGRRRNEKLSWFKEHKKDPLKKFQKVTPFGDIVSFAPIVEPGKESEVENLLSSYHEHFWDIDDIFIDKTSGVKTGCTPLVVDVDENALHERLTKFCDEKISDTIIKESLKGKSQRIGDYWRGWKRAYVAREISKNKPIKNKLYKYDFRPFVIANIFYAPNVMREASKGDGARPREELFMMCESERVCGSAGAFAMAKDLSNINSAPDIFSVFVRYLPDNDLARRGSIRIYPTCRMDDSTVGQEKRSNISSTLEKELMKFYKERNIDKLPKDVGRYINGILSCEFFRDNFFEIIQNGLDDNKIKIPFPDDSEVYFYFVNLGKSLEDIYYSSNEIAITDDEIPEKFRLERIKYDEINKILLFKGKPKEIKIKMDPNIYNFRMLGYGVLEEFLKYKKYKYMKKEMKTHDWEEIFRTIDKIQKYINLTSSEKSKIYYSRLMDGNWIQPSDE